MTTPILILSGLSERTTRSRDWGSGRRLSDQPFDKRELIARIQAIVRRSKGHSDSVIRTGRLTVNLDTRTVEVEQFAAAPDG